MTEQQAIELLSQLSTIEGLLSIIVTFLIVFFIYKVYKLCSSFLDMFF